MKYLLCILLAGCGQIDVNVRDSKHEVTVKNLCDEKTFPEQESRRRCVEKLLDILDE